MNGKFRNILFALLVVAVVVLSGAGVWFWRGPARGIRVGTAVVSKTLCSGVFVSGLDPDLLYAEAVRPIPGQGDLAKHLKYTVDRTARQVTATWRGGFQSRAVYHDGFGCRLEHGEANATDFPSATTSDVGRAVADRPLEIAPRTPALEEALDHAFAEPAQPPYRWVKAVVILHDGKLVAERYAPGYGADTPVLGYSLAKSVTNALVGILVRQKKLSVEQHAPIAEWASDGRRDITIDQLLRMSSGLAIEESDDGLDPVSRMLFVEPDMAGYAEGAKLKTAPGIEWEYTSGNTLILSRILRDAVGGHAEDVRKLARKELFEPLGITTATIEFDSAGTPVGSIYVLMSARDWARFGELYRNDGVVNGRRILPEGWVSYSAAPTLHTDYGAGFWTNRGAHENGAKRIQAGMPEDAFYGSGNLGQRVLVIPSERLVIVRLGLTHAPPGFDMRGLLQLTREASAALHGG